MSYELSLLGKVLNSKNPEKEFLNLSEGVPSFDIFLEHKDKIDYIREYQASYGKIPEAETFATKFPTVILPSSKEPVKFYIEEVYKTYAYEKMSEVNDKIVGLLSQRDPIAAMEMTEELMKKLNQSSSVSSDINLSDSVEDRIEHYENRRDVGVVTGIPTGWTRLDQETTGWQKSEVTYIVGRMGSFKSWLLISWAIHAWEQGNTVLIFSREMGNQQVARRIDTFITKTRFKDIKQGSFTDDDFTSFTDRLKDTFVDKHPFYIVDTAKSGKYTTAFIQQKIREYKPDIVYIDGVYLLEGKGNAEWEKQTAVSRAIKQLALTENIPIIGTLQANRGSAGKKEDVKTQNVAYSDAYGQDADNMVAINRTWDDRIEDFTEELKISLIKVRDGESITMHVDVDLDNMSIVESSNSFSTPGANSLSSAMAGSQVFSTPKEAEGLLL